MFVKTAFQVLKLKFLACIMKQAFYPFYKQNIARALATSKTFLQALRLVRCCQKCMCKRGIENGKT